MAGEIGEAFVRIRPEVSSFRGETTAAVRRDLKQTEREVSRFARGTVLGTGALHGFGRAAVFASTSLLGGYGLTFALRKSLDAARDSQVVQGQLTAAVRAAGIQYAAYRGEIQQSIRATDDLGFSEDEAARSYTTLISATRDVTTATKDQALAANIARQTGRSLEQATRAVAQAEAGRAGALQRMLPAITKGASAEKSLLQATAATAGAAEKYSNSFAGSQERLSSAISKTEITIGRALIPTVERLSNRVADYLNNAENQRRLQEQVNRVIEDGTQVVQGLAAGIDTVRPPIEAVIGALGGLENAVQAALVLGVVVKARKAAIAMGLIRTASVRTATVVGTSAVAETAAISATNAALGRQAAGFGVTAAASTAARNTIIANAAAETAAIGRTAGLLRGLIGAGGILGTAVAGGYIAGQIFDKNSYNMAELYQTAAGSGTDAQLAQETIKKAGLPALLRIQDVAAAISGGQLTLAGLATLRSRFASAEEYAAAVRLAKYDAAERVKGLPKGLPNVVGGAGRDTRVSPIAPTSARAIFLAKHPENVAAITEQRDYDQRALDFLEKQRAAGKITNAKYVEQTLAISLDQQSQQQHLDSIREEAARAAQAARDQAQADAEQRQRDAEAAAERARIAAERAAALRAKQYRDRLHIQEQTLRTAVKTTHDSAQADRKLTDFLRREAHDKRLTGVERSDYAARLADETGREQERDKRIAEQLRKAATLGATVINAASDAFQKVQEHRLEVAKKARETALQIREGGLSLARQAAGLAEARAGTDQKLLDKALTLEKRADLALIKFYKERIAATKGLERQGYRQQLISAQMDLAGLGKKKAAGQTFTLAQLYAEAESQFKTYGSNYGPSATTPLSPQDARGQFAAITLKQKGTVNVTQHFHAPTRPSQAMNDARTASRYLN